MSVAGRDYLLIDGESVRSLGSRFMYLLFFLLLFSFDPRVLPTRERVPGSVRAGVKVISPCLSAVKRDTGEELSSRDR